MTIPHLQSATRRRLLTVTAALAIGLVPAVGAPTPAVAAPGAAPAVGHAAPAPQRVPLDGVYNARTFGSYRTADGRQLTGRVIRSGDLQTVTDSGLAELRRRQVTTIVDLRTSVETTVKPNRPVPGAQVHHRDVMLAAPLAGAADFFGMYRVFVDNPAAREAYRGTLLDIARTVNRGDSIVVHCSAGRDRTGWAAAVLLRIAGAEMSTIEADFIAGDNGVDVGWLRGAFAHADQLYGDFDNYLRTGLRLTPADLANIHRAALA